MRTRHFTGIVLALAALAVACDTGGGSSPTTTRRDRETTTSSAAGGGTLRVAVVGLDSLDPALAEGPGAVLASRLLFEPLVGLDEDGQPAPGLAEEWSADATLTRWTFTLIEGARFHDGSAVTSADVKASLQRIARVGSHLAALLAGVTGMETPDERSLVVVLGAPDAVLPARLTNPGLAVMPAAQASALAVRDSPVGSGPFAVTSVAPETVRLERADDRGSGDAASLDAVELMRVATLDDAVAAFEADRVDVAAVPVERADLVNRRDARPLLAVGLYVLDLRNPLFDDARFREAIVRAVNPSAVVAAAYENAGESATGLVPPAVPGAPGDACVGVCEHDPERARAALAEAYPSGGVPPVPIDFDDSPVQQEVAAALAEQLASVGIPTELRPHPFDDYGTTLAAGAVGLFRFGMVGDAPVSDVFLASFRTDAPENVAGISVPELDAALDAARSTAGARERAARYGEGERALLASYAVVPIVAFDTRVAIADGVRELRVDPYGALVVTSGTAVRG